MEKLGAQYELNQKLRDDRDDIRAERDTLRSTVAALKKRIQELETAAEIPEQPAPPAIYDKNAVWIALEGGERDGPYCQTCYGAGEKKQFIRLAVAPRRQGHHPSGSCGSCKTMVLLIDGNAEPKTPREREPSRYEVPPRGDRNWLDEKF